jgi:hypothetical protein
MINKPYHVIAYLIVVAGAALAFATFSLAVAGPQTAAGACPAGTVFDHEERSQSGNVVTITPFCRRIPARTFSQTTISAALQAAADNPQCRPGAGKTHCNGFALTFWDSLMQDDPDLRSEFDEGDLARTWQVKMATDTAHFQKLDGSDDQAVFNTAHELAAGNSVVFATSPDHIAVVTKNPMVATGESFQRMMVPTVAQAGGAKRATKVCSATNGVDLSRPLNCAWSDPDDITFYVLLKP